MNEKTETPEKEYAKGLFCSLLAECNETGICDACENVKTAFLAGAKWQAEQDQETIELAEDHAYFAGSVNEREKMMKNAEECELYYDGDFLAIDLDMKELGYSERDKVRIIVLPKEE